MAIGLSIISLNYLGIFIMCFQCFITGIPAKDTLTNKNEERSNIFPYNGNLKMAFTTESAKFGTLCSNASLILPSYELNMDPTNSRFEKFSDSNNTHRSIDELVNKEYFRQSHSSYSKFKELWMCLKVMPPNSYIYKAMKIKKKRKKFIDKSSFEWIHQGEPSLNYQNVNDMEVNLHNIYIRTVPTVRLVHSITPVHVIENVEDADEKEHIVQRRDTDIQSVKLDSGKDDHKFIGDTVLRTKESINLSDSVNEESSLPKFDLRKNNLNMSEIVNDLEMLSDDPNFKDNILSNPKSFVERDLSNTDVPSTIASIQKDSDGGFKVVPRAYGLRLISEAVFYSDNSVYLKANTLEQFQIFGDGFDQNTEIQFTAKEDTYGSRCDVHTSEVFKVVSHGTGWAIVNVLIPVMSGDQDRWYLCVRAGSKSIALHQGRGHGLTVVTYTNAIPLWIQIILLGILLVLSGLFSGLNLGLMALDKTELKIVMNTGSPKERRYARAIEPVRRQGNFLLCTLLLGNVLVNSTLTILLDMLSGGLVAVIGSTIGIVIFGEIVPQAICSRHGLAIGAKTAWLVRIFMVITGLISWPISKVLDLLLGEELGNTYDRERLKELIRVTQGNNDIREEEQNIICGALELHKKKVSEVMTKLEDVFMLNSTAIMDFGTINEIMKQGYSRIPVYEETRTNIIAVLFIKDLALMDPDDNTPLQTLVQFYQNPVNFVFEDTTLDVLFKEFKEGQKGHMALVQRVNNEGDCDPFYEVIGLITLEDIIEELIQEEIVDETDVFMDNRTKRRRKHIQRDYHEFSQAQSTSQAKKMVISPQMQVATLQYLRTAVEPFKDGQLSESILKRLLQQDIVHLCKPQCDKGKSFIYTQGKAVDYFVLIIEGQVEVTIGRENLSFESGPFTYFGLSVLSGNPAVGESPSLSTQLSRNSIVGSIQSLDTSKMLFTPDYTVKCVSEVTYLKIRRQHYIAARRAYTLEQSQKEPRAGEGFEEEMKKILNAENVSPSQSESPKQPELSKVNSTKDSFPYTRDANDSLELSMVDTPFISKEIHDSKSVSSATSGGDKVSSVAHENNTSSQL